MTGVTLAQIFGDRSVYPHQAVELISQWFDSMDTIVITGKEPPLQQLGPRPRLQSVRITVKKFVEEMMSDSGEDKLAALCADMDLYFAVAPVISGTRGPRLKRADITALRGITLDLDVKEGAFASEEQGMEFLSSLAYHPSFMVGTGSGGIHAYWRFDRPVAVSEGEALIRAWWAYANEIAMENYGADIDRLIDSTRMLRVPGSLRYPKTEGEVVSPVTMLGVTGVVVTPDQIREVTQDAVQRRDEHVAQVRKTAKEVQEFVPTQIEGVSDSIWAQAVISDDVSEWIQTIPWSTILGQLGWTFILTDADGRDHWARPGSSAKSATVNWPESPNVMALHSTSRETGLADLHEAGVALTKQRVLLRLFFADDNTALYNWAMAEMNSQSVDNSEDV